MFLRLLDYYKQIQSDNLLQIITDDDQQRTNAELAAEAEMKSYLAQRYVLTKIFAATTSYSDAATYKGKNLVEYSEPAWDIATAYVLDDRVSYGGKIYKALGATTGDQPDTVPASWAFVVNDKQLYYITLPETEYNNSTVYQVSDSVWYNDSVYTATKVTSGNLPTDSNFWSAGTPYSVTGIKPTDNTKWTKGDNRNQQMVLYMVDITLYHLHSRINPRNIPELRFDRYDEALKWLKMVASGDITADLPEIDPESGLSIRWGSQTKNQNYY